MKLDCGARGDGRQGLGSGDIVSRKQRGPTTSANLALAYLRQCPA
jgi:hypothetical protein